MTTQYVSEARLCDRVGLIDRGQMVADGTPDELRRQAFGGDMVDLVTAAPLGEGVLERMAASAAIHVERWERIDRRTMRLVVKDASEQLPHLMRWLRDHDIEVETCAEHVANFDDVFVALVKARHSEEPRPLADSTPP